MVRGGYTPFHLSLCGKLLRLKQFKQRTDPLAHRTRYLRVLPRGVDAVWVSVMIYIYLSEKPQPFELHIKLLLDSKLSRPSLRRYRRP